MWTDLKAAVRAGVLAGVKGAVIALFLLAAVTWFLRDYEQTRARAAKGEQAFGYLQSLAAAKKAAPKE